MDSTQAELTVFHDSSFGLLIIHVQHNAGFFVWGGVSPPPPQGYGDSDQPSLPLCGVFLQTFRDHLPELLAVFLVLVLVL